MKWKLFDIVSEFSGNLIHETSEQFLEEIELPDLPDASRVLIDCAKVWDSSFESYVLKAVDNYNTVEVVLKTTGQTLMKYRRQPE